MIKLNDNNIYVGQIKQLLKDFNLPTCNVYKKGIATVKGNHYIKDGYICLCNDSGELENETLYVYNKAYLNLTKNLVISNNIYDNYTHRYLGDYLRFIRDYNGVDLMSMYNCCDGYLAKDINVRFNGNSFVDDNEYAIYCFPVKFNKEYTIGINCPSRIELFAGFFDDNKIIDIEDSEYLYIQTYQTISNPRLNKPFLYSKLSISDEKFNMYEKELKLFVKVPENCKSTLVVLEGNFIDNFNIDLATHKFDKQILQYRDKDEDIDYIYNEGAFLSVIELMSYLNSTYKGLLATRLMEYLTGNVISPLSEDYDVSKMQSKLIKKKLVESDYLGIWSKEDRLGIYNMISKEGIINTEYDMLSYLDKDAENLLGDLD